MARRTRWTAAAAVVAVAAVAPWAANVRVVTTSTVHADLLTAATWSSTAEVRDEAGLSSDEAGMSSDEAWLETGTIPGAGTRWADLVRDALLDLHRLTAANGAVAAGAAERWGYTWPRDGAFVAVALATTGHTADAERLLDFLGDVQDADGGFQARYVLSGDGTPDDREPQSDGAGWVLWAVDQVASASPAPAAVAERFRDLVDRATGFVLDQVADGARLPPPSSDYWERDEATLTLGIAAPLLAGLRSSARLFAELDDVGAVVRSTVAANRLEARLVEAFGADGYQRYPTWGGVDAAVCFLMPPFAAHPSAAVVAAWQRYQLDAIRPAGGLAPGAGWKNDGISWTPETALVALTAASDGRPDVAARWLDWLDAHRTAWGSLPEKVNADGTPGGPAPLAWTAASVVLAVATLDAPGTTPSAPSEP
ncbi:glycoside hydrolase family 15 [Cellulomonas sp. P24]|uniref:glycoside hydrolase family 15 n=1 Tax=Cellulomonas sp. P24 TaxID=2885206 RepID=UPI00216B4260|nr:glycoside hydrolase family 15 [Cellulomonas sp. P24]MCR6491596.1 hypothetical protein [Cellulomonas sp. P24]